MSGTMRGVYTNLTEIRRRVFAEVAKIAYDAGGDNAEEGLDSIAHNLRNLPYEMIPGDVATYRESVFLERAIVQRAHPPRHGSPAPGPRSSGMSADGGPQEGQRRARDLL